MGQFFAVYLLSVISRCFTLVILPANQQHAQYARLYFKAFEDVSHKIERLLHPRKEGEGQQNPAAHFGSDVPREVPYDSKKETKTSDKMSIWSQVTVFIYNSKTPLQKL